jgi:hypothetical protein
MSLIIVISDGISWTEIGCGIKPRGSIRRVIAAGQIQYWDQSQFVASPNTGSTPDWPFINGGGGGDCRFDTGSLFCFAGAPNRFFDNVLMVLWNFPVKPVEDVDPDNPQQQGYLTSQYLTSQNGLAGGPIFWAIRFADLKRSP